LNNDVGGGECPVTEAEERKEPVKEIFDELFALLEDLETRDEALAEFLKAEGLVTDEKLQPYLDRAGKAASVRWRAARARMEHLFTPIPVAVREAKKEADALQQEAKAEKDKKQDGQIAGSESQSCGRGEREEQGIAGETNVSSHDGADRLASEARDDDREKSQDGTSKQERTSPDQPTEKGVRSETNQAGEQEAAKSTTRNAQNSNPSGKEEEPSSAEERDESHVGPGAAMAAAAGENRSKTETKNK
jgi:hypothetical protein